MGVRKATGFLTSDGRFFPPQEEEKANEHEVMIKLKELCDELRVTVGPEGETDLPELLFARRSQLLRILNGLDEPTVRGAGDGVRD